MDKALVLDRIKGSLWGALIGDSYGALYEFTPRDKMPLLNQRVTELLYRTPLPLNAHGYPLGTITDDGIQIMITLETLVKGDLALDLSAIRRKFIRWVDRGYWTPDKVCFDVGTNTLQGLFGTKVPNKRQEGNGALMRIPPIAAVMHLGDEQVHKFVRITHKSNMPEFYEVHNQFVWALRSLILTGDAAFMKHLHIYDRKYAPIPTAMDTYALASTVMAERKGFIDGLNRVISFGHDTDTNACVYGALKGAEIGYKALPKWMITPMWRKSLIGKIIDNFAQKVVESGCTA